MQIFRSLTMMMIPSKPLSLSLSLSLKRKEKGAYILHICWAVRNKQPKNVKKKSIKHTEETAMDEDVVGDFVLSSDEDDDPLSDSLEEDDEEAQEPQERSSKKRKQGANMHKGKGNVGNKKSKKRKKTHGK